jgi:hypothetical protein
MDKFIWDATKSSSFRLSRVRNITINSVGIEKSVLHAEGFQVVIWFSDSESLVAGEFVKLEGARDYVESIHKEVEK